jgi:hypothetical protein
LRLNDDQRRRLTAKAKAKAFSFLPYRVRWMRPSKYAMANNRGGEGEGPRRVNGRDGMYCIVATQPGRAGIHDLFLSTSVAQLRWLRYTLCIAVGHILDSGLRRSRHRSAPCFWGAVAAFERPLIWEPTQAGQQRQRNDYDGGKVGRTVYSRSGRTSRRIDQRFVNQELPDNVIKLVPIRYE